MTVRLGFTQSGHPRQGQRHLREHEKGEGGPTPQGLPMPTPCWLPPAPPI